MNKSKKMYNARLHKARKLKMKRIRLKLKGGAERPRLSVFRSNKHIYAQIIDDKEGRTLVSYSSKALNKKIKKTDIAKEVGHFIACKAKESGIDAVVFDRGRYAYHGAVKALAEGAREEGLKF